MAPQAIFYPMFAMVGITMAVGGRLLQTRVGQIRRKRVHPSKLADPDKWDEVLKDVSGPSDAFENLFEIPVLLYVISLALFVTGRVSPFFVGAAWAFVFFRAVQAWVGCTSNHIMRRAQAYWLGCLAMFAMWIGFAWQLLS